jgi:hypothetical protein
MPVFRFSPERLNAIAAYVQSLRDPPSPGGLAVAEIGPVAEGFLAGTIGVVTLLVLARWIARGGDEDQDEPEGGASDPTAGPEDEPRGGRSAEPEPAP